MTERNDGSSAPKTLLHRPRVIPTVCLDVISVVASSCGYNQIPPDLVVKFQAIDIVEVI
jgi:hypothetical protein